MFDLAFEPQVTKILGNVRPDRQTVMFSATFPRQIKALARKILLKPVEVQVGGRSVVCRDVYQSVNVINKHQKYFKLLELLGVYHEKGSILVFVERQGMADTLIRDLMKSSYACMALHGGMDQFDRDLTTIRFRLTTREVLDDIGEYSEFYITVRGLYVPEAQKLNDLLGEKQLYLSIEAKSERAVQLAKQEIKRVIREEAQHMASRVKPVQHTVFLLFFYVK